MEIFNRQFGLAIAYLLPGFIALAGIAPLVPVVSVWLEAGQTASLGAPLYALLAATATGMIVSCFRWALVDPLHTLTGVVAPTFDARALSEHPTVFNFLVESDYRYYQFDANTLVAIIWTYSIFRAFRVLPRLGLVSDIGIIVLSLVLFAGSRDALFKYRSRIKQLSLETPGNSFEDDVMTNGIDHNQGSGSDSKKHHSP